MSNENEAVIVTPKGCPVCLKRNVRETGKRLAPAQFVEPVTLTEWGCDDCGNYFWV